MATFTDNYQLTKPTYAEQADIGVINSNMNKIDEVMHSSQISLAPAYDQSQTYAEGDKVMYELLMYKCISPTTGVWDASKWERTTASESGGGGSAELDILGEASGAVASFADGASAGLAKCIAEINPTQDLHGYDNPWAGGAGKNKAELTVTAIKANNSNLVWNENEATHNGVTYTILTDYDNNVVGIKAHGLASALSMLYIVKNVNYNDNITMSGCPTGGTLQSYEIQSSIGSNTYRDYGSGISFSWNQSASMVIIIRSGFNANNLIFKPMIRTSGDSTFEPYSNICPISGHSSVTVTVSDGETSTTKTTPLGQTVYGGQLNVLTGELTIDRQIVDLGSLTWTRTDNSIIDVGYWFHANVSGKIATGETINSNYRTAPYKSVTQLVNAEGSAVDKVAVEAGGEVGYRIIDSSYTDATAFKTAMNGVQMCYFLATPQTVQLTPQEVNSLLGQNNISADTGDVDIVYVKASAPIQPNPTGTPTATLKKLGIEGTVFEVEGGGGGSSSGINYSTTEQVIGTWIDGKPLYMRTFDLGSDIQVPYNTFINTTIDAIDKKAIIDAFGIYSTGETFYPLVANINNGIVRLQACRDNQVALVQYVTIKYIKITD